MTSLRGALAPCIAMLAGCLAAAGEPLGSPEVGVLLLRNGQVLSGPLERFGDQFVILVGKGAKVHVPAADVDLHCRTLHDAYLRKAGSLDPAAAARQHLDLAEWCLRQGLHRQTAEQLSAALAADPGEPRIAQVELRLRETLSPPAPQVSKKVTVPARLDDLEETMRSIPASAVERFTSSVQPVLLNRCSTSNCHGTASKSSFKLLRPAAGDPITRRYTQRNLHAVLQTIDRAAPEASPLLVAPRGAHGNAAAAVFGVREERQYEQLVEWVKQVAQAKDSSPSASLASAEPRLMQSAGAQEVRTLLKPPVPSVTPGSKSKPPLKPPSAKPAEDPFDPELFNRRYFDGKE